MDWPLLTIIAALIAAVINIVVGFMERWYRHLFLSRYYQKIWITIGLFAAFYAGSFLWLKLGEVDQGTWSRFMVRFSALSFVTVWSAPAAIRGYKLYYARQLERKLRR